MEFLLALNMNIVYMEHLRNVVDMVSEVSGINVI